MSGKSSVKSTSSATVNASINASTMTITTSDTDTNTAGVIMGSAIGTTVGGVAIGSGGSNAIGLEGLSKKKRNVYQRLGVNEIYSMVDEKSLQTKQEVVIIEGTYLLTNF